MSIVRVPTDIPIDSNIWLIKGRSCMLVDTGTGLSAGFTESVYKALGGLRLSAVMLTHCHADHVGGLNFVKQEFGCPAYIGWDDVPPLRDADPDITFSHSLGVSLSPCLDVLGLKDGDVFDIGDHRLIVISTPGHTKGGICLYDEVTRGLFSGDTVFARGFGRTDLPTGSVNDMVHSLVKLSNVNIKTLYPGHGPLSEDGNGSVQFAVRMAGP